MNSLFLAPHNDDETLFGAFTLLHWKPFVLVCLRSHRMADPAYPGNHINGPVKTFTREFETEMAMKALDCQWDQWDFRDDDPDWDQLAEQLEIFDNGRYEQIFAPMPEEGGHDQHNRIGGIAREIFGDRVTYYLTYTASGKSTWGVPIRPRPEWIALKHHALACYKSQSAHPATYLHFLNDLHEYYAA